MAQTKLELLLELKNRLKAGLSSAKGTLMTEMKDMKEKLGSFSSSNMKAFKGITDQIPGLGSALSLLANPYALAATAALSFGAATATATSMALDWQKSMAKVNVTAQLGSNELAALSNKILEIGSRGSTDLMQVPEAFNKIISAGLDVNQSLLALEPTLKAAKAGFADIETVAAAGIGVMKSSGENIRVVYDTLFATLNKGNAEFKDIAQYLPKIIPGARLAGATLGETAGAFAFLTAQGQTAEQSTTGLMNAFKALSDPSFINGFKKIGVNVFDVQGKFRGIVPVVDDLKKQMVGLSDEQKAYKFDLIGLDMEARGAFAGMIQNVNELKTTIDFTSNSTGQLEAAVKNAKTATDDWATGWNKLKAGAISYGQSFIPIVEATGKWFNMLVLGPKNSSALIDEFKAQQTDMQKQKKDLQDLFNKEKNELVKTQIQQAIGMKDSALENVKSNIMNSFQDEINTLKNEVVYFDKRLASPLALDDRLKARQDRADAINALRDKRIAYGEFVLGSRITPSGPITPKSSENNNKDANAPVNSSPSATQSKSIVFNIGTLYKADNKISTGSEGMSITEFERKMNEVLMRTIRNVESSY